MFEWPDSKLSDAEFLTLICGETGAGLLLDIENVYLNASNHAFDPYAFLDAAARDRQGSAHGGGHHRERRVARPSPCSPIPTAIRFPTAALDLLAHVLTRQTPAIIILERDDRLDAADEILDDVARIRACVANSIWARSMAKRLVGSADLACFDYLTSGAAIFGDKRRAALDPALQGLDSRPAPASRPASPREAHGEDRRGLPPHVRIAGAAIKPQIVREFVPACPPVDIGHLTNARQFHDFLSARWQSRRPSRRICPTSATCELACATVGAAIEATA